MMNLKHFRQLWLLLALLLIASPVFAEQQSIAVKFIKEKVPIDAIASLPIFEQVPQTTIPFLPQMIAQPGGGGSVKEAKVRVLHDGEQIYVQMIWEDKTKDVKAIRYEQFTDSAAVQFPVFPGELPSPFMGDKFEKDHPVNIWHWKANWQEDLKAFQDLKQEYANMHADFYYARDLAQNEELKKPYNPGIASGNLLSQQKRQSPVEDLNAAGFGTLTTQEQQDVMGSGAWQDGKWMVLFARPLRTSDGNDVQFIQGQSYLINFAVWDGSNKDRNGQKSVSLLWYTITLP